MNMRCNRLGKAFCSSWRRFAPSRLRALAKTTVLGVDKTWTGDQGNLSGPLVTGHRTSELGNTLYLTCFASSAPMPREAPEINQTAEGAIEHRTVYAMAFATGKEKHKEGCWLEQDWVAHSFRIYYRISWSEQVQTQFPMNTYEFLLFPTQILRCSGSELSIWLSIPDPMLTVSSLRQLYSHDRQRIAKHSRDVDASANPGKHCSSDSLACIINRSLCTVY